MVCFLFYDSLQQSVIGVGKGAATPPALVILSYHPKDAKKTLAMVGKGIVLISIMYLIISF